MSSDTNTFVAWRVEETDDGDFVGSEQTLPIPESGGDATVRVKVTHSSLNYKDALSAAGNPGVTRSFPHTPGIDAAGTLVGGDDDGASVLVTGYDLGMNTDGGFGESITVPRDWIVTPNPFGGEDAARTAMVYGTAGLTAGLCVQKLLTAGGAKPSDGTVLVTGATGGVGSVAVELLAKLGFEVVALTGKLETDEAWLKDLGASKVVGRDALEPNKRPLLRPSYAHAVDTVGGEPLAQLLKTIQNGGSVAACGNAAGLGVKTTVLPFILRGVNLLGVDSVEIPLEQKKDVWNKLSGEWSCPKAEASAREIGRDALDGCLKKMLEGGSHGRTVLVHGATVDSKL